MVFAPRSGLLAKTIERCPMAAKMPPSLWPKRVGDEAGMQAVRRHAGPGEAVRKFARDRKTTQIPYKNRRLTTISLARPACGDRRAGSAWRWSSARSGRGARLRRYSDQRGALWRKWPYRDSRMPWRI
jgi:hypothetical protein